MNCNGLARWYRSLEYAGFGRALERRRAEFLASMASARRVLVLGDGDGRFLAAFLRVNRVAEVDSVDGSAAMLVLARQRVEQGDTGRVRFHHADARGWQPPTSDYNLIVTHFFLDCFTDAELRSLIPRLTACTAAETRWVVSEFRQPAQGLAAWHARMWLTGLYAFFRITTGLHVRRLPDYAAILAAAGFRLESETVAHAGLLTSQLWQRRLAAGFPV